MNRRLALGACALFVMACELELEPRDGDVGDRDAAIDAGDASSRIDSGDVPRADAGPDAGPPIDLDGFIEWQMEAGGLPGVAAAIIEDGAITWIGTYGHADIEAGRLVDPHTLFIMASISKTMAATRAMQLVEAGLLDLDEPVETYVPYSVRHPAYPSASITMRMLLTHVSGVEDNFAILGGVTTNGSDPVETLAGFAEGYVSPGGEYYSDSNFGAEPRTRRSYCNACFGIVGDVIERVGGASYREQTGAAIFEPLAMDGAGWFLADVDAARLATPYGFNGRSFSPLPQNGFAYYPAASLRVSVTGLARFLLAIAGGGELDGERILGADSVAEMQRIQFPGVSSGQALTFSERWVNGHLYIGHSGSTYGGSTQMLLSREGTHGMILLTNSDAYVREVFGLEAGARAMNRILERLDEEALAP